MGARLTVGQFSSMTHLSIKTLRRYHDRGLLLPAEVDEWTGYRYYDPVQISVAQTIRRLRDLDMPLEEIAGLIGEADDRRRHELLTGHLHRLEERLMQTQDAVAALRRLLAPEPSRLVVEREQIPSMSVLAVTAVLDQADVLGWYAPAMAELDRLLADAGRVAAGPPGALIDNAIVTDERGELTVFLPLDEPPTGGRARALTLPQVELAVTVHHGDHSDIDVTYGLLAQWALEHGLRPTGPVRETYRVGPRDTPHPREWRTGIGWPITETPTHLTARSVPG